MLGSCRDHVPSRDTIELCTSSKHRSTDCTGVAGAGASCHMYNSTSMLPHKYASSSAIIKCRAWACDGISIPLLSLKGFISFLHGAQPIFMCIWLEKVTLRNQLP